LENLANPSWILPKEVDQFQLIEIKFIHGIECGHFWAQIKNERTARALNLISTHLNSRSFEDNLLILDNPCEGELCAAYYEFLEKKLYRAKIGILSFFNFLTISLNKVKKYCEACETFGLKY
jgi:hypothetical protein